MHMNDELKNLPEFLVFDLDGTLIYRDTFHEMLLLALWKKPVLALQTMYWLAFKHRSYAKRRLSEAVCLDPSSLRYDKNLLNLARKLKADGHKLILATGTYEPLAREIADHLGCFDFVFGTTDEINLTGQNKTDRIRKELGDVDFLYVGDARVDEHVWKAASHIWVVRPKRGAIEAAFQARAKNQPLQIFR